MSTKTNILPTDTPLSLKDPSLYINRELSWLEFNQRVLDQAADPSVALLERVKFLAITASNLDEFFMVRVAGLKQQLLNPHQKIGNPDGLSPKEQLDRIAERTHRMVGDQYRLLRQELVPQLATHKIHILGRDDLSSEQKRYLAERFTQHVFPVLTPLAIDPGHPFPRLKNKRLNLAILLGRSVAWGQPESFAVVQVPLMLPRLVQIPSKTDGNSYILLEDVIALHVEELFPGSHAHGCWAFRILRNWDLTIDEDESEDLLKTIQKEVRRRERGNAVRLTITQGARSEVTRFLAASLGLSIEDIYPVDGPPNLTYLFTLLSLEKREDLKDPPHTPTLAKRFEEAETIFHAITQGDILLHHPYESFDHVVDFVSQAAEDPNVLAIKQTLYRTSGDSPIVRALERAAELGKQVTALVELKARFDEENNIAWARKLEEAGVHVVYGLIGLKTHCKVSLIVRREGDSLRRYVHLSTGNYNPNTGRLYTDLSLFTCRDDFGSDATALFNMLTGYSHPPEWKRFIAAPIGLHEKIVQQIKIETKWAQKNGKGRIIAKMNSLVDSDTIRALYAASQAGVEIDLLVRGICCLRPQVPGVSENIRVASVVDRFLEHSRIFYFENGGDEEIYLSSADWMPRNFMRRVEIMFPIEDPALRARVRDEILGTMMSDNVKARYLQADGTYTKIPPKEPLLRSQGQFITIAEHHTELAPVAPELRLRLAFARQRDTRDKHLPAVLEPKPEGIYSSNSSSTNSSSSLKTPLLIDPSS